MRRAAYRLLAVLAVLAAVAWTGIGYAQNSPIECGEYEGVVCQGFFTDETGVATDRQQIEDAIDRLVGEYGNPIAIVVVTDSRGRSPADFAVEIADAWGVGDPVENNGVLVLVSLDERRTEIVTQDNVEVPGDIVAGAARSFFTAGDFQGGLLAIVGTLEQALAGTLIQPGGDGTRVWPYVLGILGVVLALGAIGLVVGYRRSRALSVQRKRESMIDGDLNRLEPSGEELPHLSDYAAAAPSAPSVDTASALRGVYALLRGDPPGDTDALRALWSDGGIIIVDRDRLIAETREPLELRASDERPILENAVQQAAEDALAVDWREETEFTVRRDDLDRLINSLRPHRVAAARRRTADTLAAQLVATTLGDATLTELGERLARSGPALDPQEPLEASLAELAVAYEAAEVKANRLERLYEALPASTTRPAVAAALADIGDDPDAAVARFETVRSELESAGSRLETDGLDVPAIAALLLLNNDASNVQEFLDAYAYSRDRGFAPAEAVEHALADLMTAGEIDRVRNEADRLGLPVSITAALLRRRDDGPEVYQQLRDEVSAHVDAASARTVAGVLAVSLEPAQALRRWLAAREALHELGLRGTYADVAAAFGASDPRGPRGFALAYAAQRQALAASTIDDADRFAPELAHAGTSDQRDSWSGEAIPPSLGSFDPFTLFYYHWIITRGHAGSYGWEPIYRDRSWSQDRSSWWGGSGGFGSSGGSSWGGSSWGGSGGFGGFGGGGGFSGGGGGGW